MDGETAAGLLARARYYLQLGERDAARLHVDLAIEWLTVALADVEENMDGETAAGLLARARYYLRLGERDAAHMHLDLAIDWLTAALRDVEAARRVVEEARAGAGEAGAAGAAGAPPLVHRRREDGAAGAGNGALPGQDQPRTPPCVGRRIGACVCGACDTCLAGRGVGWVAAAASAAAAAVGTYARGRLAAVWAGRARARPSTAFCRRVVLVALGAAAAWLVAEGARRALGRRRVDDAWAALSSSPLGGRRVGWGGAAATRRMRVSLGRRRAWPDRSWY